MTHNPAPGDRDPHQGRDLPPAGMNGPAGERDVSASAAGADDAVPFGLPVLAEVPELAMVLEDLVAVDRILARALEGIIRLQEHSISESATGLPLERWLAAIARRTGSDRRMLATAATACRRLPSLRAAFGRGRLSWAQVRTVALKIERLPRHLDDRVDAAVADALDAAPDTDPDALVRVIGWALEAIEADAAPDTAPAGQPQADWLALQPRLTPPAVRSTVTSVRKASRCSTPRCTPPPHRWGDSVTGSVPTSTPRRHVPVPATSPANGPNGSNSCAAPARGRPTTATGRT
jgi:hypothetical protein